MSQIAFLFFFFNDTATTEIYTLSLHDALPISDRVHLRNPVNLYHGGRFDYSRGPQVCESLSSRRRFTSAGLALPRVAFIDRKSTRLNSSHSQISYAVFCLKKKKKNQSNTPRYL